MNKEEKGQVFNLDNRETSTYLFKNYSMSIVFCNWLLVIRKSATSNSSIPKYLNLFLSV
jgi:hypothetical protein